jgi:dolichol-phosphate mannosyltransferase
MPAANERPEAPPDRTISVIVTAMNEEANLRPTVEAVVASVAPRFVAYEILVIDDGSQDRTGDVAAGLAAENPHVRVYRNPVNRGLASSYRRGIGLAAYQHTSWVAGNNLVPAHAFDAIYERVGDADMVVTYLARDVRGPGRRFLSRAFTRIVNLLFGTRLRYFTGPCVYRTAAAKQVQAVARGSMFVAEMLLRLVKAGESYVQVGIHPLPRSSGASKSFRLRNIVAVGGSILELFWNVRIRQRALAGAPPKTGLPHDEKISA